MGWMKSLLFYFVYFTGTAFDLPFRSHGELVALAVCLGLIKNSAFLVERW